MSQHLLKTKSRKQELSEKASEEQRRYRDWLLNFMRNKQPKFLTKAELREAAMRELKISKNSFDFAWIAAILETGRDAYGPTSEHGTPPNLLRCELAAVGYRETSLDRLTGSNAYLAIFAPPSVTSRTLPEDMVACKAL